MQATPFFSIDRQQNTVTDGLAYHVNALENEAIFKPDTIRMRSISMRCYRNPQKSFDAKTQGCAERSFGLKLIMFHNDHQTDHIEYYVLPGDQ